MKTHSIHILLLLTLLLTACGPAAERPATFTDTDEVADIYPDYGGVTVPPNIAPLTFIVRDSLADAFVVEFTAEGNSENCESSGNFIVAAKSGGLVQPDTAAWRTLLQANTGKTAEITVYARSNGQWKRHRPLSFSISDEPIDAYLSYRLIEPGYELYRQLGIYQRNLTTYEETPIYENNRTFDDDENHCVNCHNYQANDTRRMLFHVRSNHGGTIIIDNGEISKIGIKHDSILSAGVYPSWHPTLPLVAFSTNLTGQIFHMQHSERIEVLDEASDLLLYDAKENTVSKIFSTNKQFETFPCWAPSGDRLYYVSADVPNLPDTLAPKDRGSWMMEHYSELHYNIWSMPFDTLTRTFGEPQLEVDCAAEGKSASVPRISPDGRFLLYTVADYGQFHIWHKSADLCIRPTNQSAPHTAPEGASIALPTDSIVPHSGGERGANLNSPEAESFHSWSSNSRWIAFASRRDDGNFTRIYISYIDSSGNARKPFLLPQLDPRQNIRLLKSYNVPELTRNPVQVSTAKIRKAVLEQEQKVSKFIEK